MRFLYRDEHDPHARPQPIRNLHVDLPHGTRIDESTVPVCDVDEDDIRARGTDACPRATLMAKGTLVARTGALAADPFVGDVHFFHGPGHWIEMVTARGSTSVVGYDRFHIEGRRLRASPPVVPGGPPDGETAIREVVYTMEPRIAGGRSFFTTPPACPADGRWVTRGSFTFADGIADPAEAVSRCTAFVAAPVGVTLRPRRVRAGRRTAIAVRVAPAGSACARGATVRLGARRALTGTGGRATLVTTLPRPGLARLIVTRPGCPKRAKTLRVLP
jgi:hypothetical protein